MMVESIVPEGAHYGDAGNATITCQVKFVEFDGAVPFTATGDGVEPHEQAVWTALIAGEAGPIAPYQPAQTGAAPPAPYSVFKADVWRRCTDDEAEQLDAAIRAQTVRLRRLFDDATLLRSDDDLFGNVQAAVVRILGAERAAVVLAPSQA